MQYKITMIDLFYLKIVLYVLYIYLILFTMINVIFY